LSADPADASGNARLQAAVAQLYGLSTVEFQHVLDTFPLIPGAVKSAAMREFAIADIAPGSPHHT
jgi:hypothetical protein